MLKLKTIKQYDFSVSPQKLRHLEIFNYLQWFINIRWLIAATIILFGILSSLKIIPAEGSYLLIIFTGFFLLLCNFVYIILINLWFKKKEGYFNRAFICFQIIIDFLAIIILYFSISNYEILFILAFTFHLILSSIFLPRKTAFFIFSIAAILASLSFWYYHSIKNPVLFSASNSLNIITPDHIFLIFLNSGIIICYLGIWFITSEMTKNLISREDLLIKQYKKLLEIEEEKNKLSLRATHELKAPFAAIKSYLYTLRDGYCGPLKPVAQDTVNKMIIRSDQLTSRITDIILLSKLKTSVFDEKHYIQSDIIKIINDILIETTENCKLNKIKMNNKINISSLKILMIPDQIQTMLSNLINNAINYSFPDKEVTISLKEKKDHIIITVADQGIGIEKDAQNKIFEEYYRTGTAIKHSKIGTGLGLSIVKEVVNLHKGKINIESEINKGTTFLVYLPKNFNKSTNLK